MRDYTEQQQSVMGRNLARIFGLKRDKEHKDRWVTGWGTKTNLGLYLTIVSIADGTHDLKRPRNL